MFLLKTQGMDLYLIDFNNRIVEKRSAISVGQSIDVTGQYPIQTPVPLDQLNPPSSVGGLLTSKFEKIAASYGFFTNYVYDDMQTSLKIDTGFSFGLTLSPRTGVGIQPPIAGSTILLSTAQPLGITPSQAVLLYEPFFYVDTDPRVGRYQRMFVLPASNDPEVALTAELSFDNGATYTTFVPGQITNIPLANQGTDLKVRFTRSSGTRRLFIGSWTVLYL